MKSILFVIPTLSGGGAEKVLVNLVNKIHDRYDITILTLFDVGVNKQHLSKQIKYKSIFKWNFKGNIYLFKIFSPSFLCKLFIHGNYDYVISFLEYAATRIVSGYSGEAKKIAWIHSTINSRTLKSFLSPYRSISECIECYNKFDQIVCVSQDVLLSFKDNILEVNTPCCVKYNILNSFEIGRLSQQSIDDLCLSNGIMNICSVGRLIPIKGYRRLLKIYRQLLDDKVALNTHLYILGVGPEEESLNQYILDNKMLSYVTLLGYKNNPYKYMKQMDLFVCSSYSEGLSTAVSESLLLGLPVLTTECSGMNELLDNGRCGLIVENSESGLYSGLKRIIESQDLLLYYKKQALARKEYFDDSKIVDDFEKLFN